MGRWTRYCATADRATMISEGEKGALGPALVRRTAAVLGACVPLARERKGGAHRNGTAPSQTVVVATVGHASAGGSSTQNHHVNKVYIDTQ